MCRRLSVWIWPVLLATLAGCSAALVPPSDLSEPVTVYVLDHGRHSSLVLPSDEGAVRYSYGDWEYYALRKTGTWNALYALLIPSPAALGRQELPQAPTVDNLPGQLRVAVVAVLPIAVESEAVQSLQRRLDGLYRDAIDTRRYTPSLGLHFVRHPRAYSLRHNSNRVVGDWLEHMGCDVHGFPVLSNWQLREPYPD